MVDDQRQTAEVYGGIEAHGDGVEAQNTGFAELILKQCMQMEKNTLILKAKSPKVGFSLLAYLTLTSLC